MLRTLLLLIVLVILIAIALVATGVVNLRQDGTGVSVETKDVEVGTTVTNVSYHYYADVAVGLCAGPIAAVNRVFADGNAFEDDKVGDMRVYLGDETQEPDPLIQAVEGADRTPAYRGLAYVVMEQLYITPFGNRLPNLTFELET